MPKIFARLRKPKAAIKKSANTTRPVARAKAAGATKVGLKPGDNWHKRNFFTEVFLPSLFAKRAGKQKAATALELKNGDLGVTWIGHASFLLQLEGHNPVSYTHLTLPTILRV